MTYVLCSGKTSRRTVFSMYTLMTYVLCSGKISRRTVFSIYTLMTYVFCSGKISRRTVFSMYTLMTYVLCARFYIDSLFCRRGAHYNQEQYVSFFFQTQKSHFSADFQGQEGVHIMQECALCNPNAGNNTAKKTTDNADLIML